MAARRRRAINHLGVLGPLHVYIRTLIYFILAISGLLAIAVALATVTAQLSATKIDRILVIYVFGFFVVAPTADLDRFDVARRAQQLLRAFPTWPVNPVGLRGVMVGIFSPLFIGILTDIAIRLFLRGR
jgi:hypothetical protein